MQYSLKIGNFKSGGARGLDPPLQNKKPTTQSDDFLANLCVKLCEASFFNNVILAEQEHSEDSYQVLGKQSQYQELCGSSKLMTRRRLRPVGVGGGGGLPGGLRDIKGMAGISRKRRSCLEKHRCTADWLHRRVTSG